VALSEYDRKLLARCLAKEPKSWEDFVDRYMGLVIHVINHSAQCRSLRLTNEDREDLAGEVFWNIVRNDFALLRQFRGESSLATYLTVITRRIVVAKLLKRKPTANLGEHAADHASNGHSPTAHIAAANADEELLQNKDEVERLLEELEGSEAQLVRLYHLEGKSYGEISSLTGMAENSIGPTLSRARDKMRKAAVKTPS
jgi:RNA polymerase sigma-70 factor (ECF subfamily)